MKEGSTIIMKSSNVQEFKTSNIDGTVDNFLLKYNVFEKNCYEKSAVMFKANITCMTENIWISSFILVSRIRIALYSFKPWITVSLIISIVLKRKYLHINSEMARMTLIDVLQCVLLLLGSSKTVRWGLAELC